MSGSPDPTETLYFYLNVPTPGKPTYLVATASPGDKKSDGTWSVTFKTSTLDPDPEMAMGSQVSLQVKAVGIGEVTKPDGSVTTARVTGSASASVEVYETNDAPTGP